MTEARQIRINEEGCVQNSNEGKQADGIFHGLNREPAVCGGTGQSLACRSLGLSFRVAGIVFHIADDLHQHGN